MLPQRNAAAVTRIIWKIQKVAWNCRACTLLRKSKLINVIVAFPSLTGPSPLLGEIQVLIGLTCSTLFPARVMCLRTEGLTSMNRFSIISLSEHTLILSQSHPIFKPSVESHKARDTHPSLAHINKHTFVPSDLFKHVHIHWQSSLSRTQPYTCRRSVCLSLKHKQSLSISYLSSFFPSLSH